MCLGDLRAPVTDRRVEVGLMLVASPALFWNFLILDIDKSAVESAACKIMQAEGLTNLKTSANGVSGRTSTVHAFIATIRKSDPPAGKKVPATNIVLFVAAGTGAKSVLEGLLAAWAKVSFL
jgi:hypothetical protein